MEKRTMTLSFTVTAPWPVMDKIETPLKEGRRGLWLRGVIYLALYDFAKAIGVGDELAKAIRVEGGRLSK